MRRPAFWIVLALLSAGAVVHRRPLLPPGLLDRRARHHDGPRPRARRRRARWRRATGSGPPATARRRRSPATTRRRRSSSSKAAARTRSRACCATTSTRRTRGASGTSRKARPTSRRSASRRTAGPTGFVEKLKEDAPGAALDAAAARRIAEDGAATRWNVDLATFALVEQGQERRPSGRVDHTFTYERSDDTLKEGRYRLRLVVSGDRLTEVTHFIKIPEAFTRRYASMRSANELIGIGSTVGLALLYVIGGIGVGLFFMMRQRYVLWRHAAIVGHRRRRRCRRSRRSTSSR